MQPAEQQHRDRPGEVQRLRGGLQDHPRLAQLTEDVPGGPLGRPAQQLMRVGKDDGVIGRRVVCTI